MAGNGGVVLRIEHRLVRLEGDHHRLGQDLAGARLGAHLHQRIGLEGRLREVAHILVVLGHGGQDLVAALTLAAGTEVLIVPSDL